MVLSEWLGLHSGRHCLFPYPHCALPLAAAAAAVADCGVDGRSGNSVVDCLLRWPPCLLAAADDDGDRFPSISALHTFKRDRQKERESRLLSSGFLCIDR